MRLFLKEKNFSEISIFSKFFLRFLSLRYGADFRRSRLVLNDSKAFESSKFTGLQPDVLAQNVQCCLKFFVLQYADDILLLFETESGMQRAVEVTLQYCKQNRMCINIDKTKYMIFSRGKVRKTVLILAEGKALERVDTFC